MEHLSSETIALPPAARSALPSVPVEEGQALLSVPTARAVRLLVGVTAGLGLAGFAGQLAVLFLPDFLGRDLFAGLTDLLGEANLPAAFSALLLLAAALLLGLVAAHRRRTGDRFALGWTALALIFAFLAVDEFAMVHDRIAPLIQRTMNTQGALAYGWVVPYAVLTLGVGAAFVRFLLAQPRWLGRALVTAGAVYVSAALGFELVEGLVSRGDETNRLLMAGLIALEEVMEMLGVILLIAALLRELRARTPEIRVRLR